MSFIIFFNFLKKDSNKYFYYLNNSFKYDIKIYTIAFNVLELL